MRERARDQSRDVVHVALQRLEQDLQNGDKQNVMDQIKQTLSRV